jgi:enoyl-CoA hydratase/carnithine racemase
MTRMAGCSPRYFLWRMEDTVATIRLDRPDRKNPLTFESYAELRDTFAHGITKTQLNQEWSMSLEQAIEAEAQAQALCMQTKDFERAYQAFVAKQKPVFAGD